MKWYQHFWNILNISNDIKFFNTLYIGATELGRKNESIIPTLMRTGYDTKLHLAVRLRFYSHEL